MLRVPSGFGLLFTGPTRRRLVLAFVGSAVAALAEAGGVLAILPLMQVLTGTDGDSKMVQWISDVTGDPSRERLIAYLGALVFGAFLAKDLFTIAFRWWMLGFVYQQDAETSERLLRHYLAAPYREHLRRNSAELIRTMNDAVSQVYAQFVVGLISAVTEALTMLAILVSLFILMPLPATGIAVYFAITGWIFLRVVRRRASQAGERMLAAFNLVYRTAMHALGGIKDIKVRNNPEYFIDEYRLARREIASARRWSMILGELPKYVFEILFIIGVSILSWAVLSTSSSGAGLSMLALFVAAGFRVLPSLVRFMGAVTLMRVGGKALSLVIDDLRTAEADERVMASSREVWAAAPSDASAPEGISIEGLTFRHQGATTDVLRDVSLTVPAGTSVALVGPSGAGKSTLVDLVLGLHEQDSGVIAVNGADIRADMAGWQRSLGMVPQDVYLMDRSLRENIRFGAPLDDDELRMSEAIAKAQLEELVDGLPAGLDTFVGERGTRLSGGQRQRIGIARALYTRPKVLILDEATSALDNETERRITATIEALHGEMTIMIVAHRLSTVRHCDQLVFLSEGRVAGVGTFDEVVASNAEFAQMASLGAIRA